MGESTAKLFAHNGWDVALIGRNVEKLNELKNELKTQVYCFPCDLSQPDQVDKLAMTLKQSPFENPLQCLVNNAGMIYRRSFLEHEKPHWLEQFQVNLFSAIEITKSVYDQLKLNAPSSVINVSSSLGIRPIANCAAYNATKSAMNSWTKSLAIEWAKDNITVNAICPGIVNTPIHKIAQHPEKNEIEKSMNSAHPLGRMGHPDEIAENIYFLTQPASRWTTGSLNIIDGGISL
ncbi:MAG: SDR family oxidoreductase [Bdellovibrionales bacterium]